MALTSREPKAKFPLTLELSDKKLPKRSWVKISQIRVLSSERLSRKLGRATDAELALILEGLAEIIG